MKLACKDFAFHVEWNKELRRAQVKSGTFDPASFQCIGAVDDNLVPNGKTFNEQDCATIVGKACGPYLLNAARYPEVKFNVLSETADFVEGELQMCGKSNIMKCTKTHAVDHLRLSCGLSTEAFGIQRYSIGLGALAIDPLIHVEIIAPKHLLSDDAFWKSPKS